MLGNISRRIGQGPRREVWTQPPSPPWGRSAKLRSVPDAIRRQPSVRVIKALAEIVIVIVMVIVIVIVLNKHNDI